MNTLSIAVLGPPTVSSRKQELSFSTRKQLAVLLYLAVEGGIHSRQKLSELFWPELDAEHGRSALRTTIMRLRESLPASSESQQQILLSSRDTLALDAAQFRLDVHVVQDAWRLLHPSSGTHAPGQQTRQARQEQLEQATSLWRGAFLAGFSLRDAPGFDDWARTQREHWHLRLTPLFATLAQMQEEAGERERAIETMTRWLAADPLNEEAYQHLMRLHLAIGDRAAAVRAYEACCTMLSEELGAEPMAETEALASRIRSATLPQHNKQAPSSSRLLSAPSSSLLTSPLVGRGAEFESLIATYWQITSGKAQAVVIEGEAGIGKTRLATEFVGWATAQGADVLRGHAFETGGRVPYQLLVDALRPRLEQENAPDDLLADVWLAELARLFPDLQERYPDLSVPLTDDSAVRTRLFEAVTHLVQALARRTPLVLLLDDVQWADVASLDLLLYLARRFAEEATPLLLVLCLRSEALVKDAPLVKWRMNLGRLLPLQRLSLPAFSQQDMQHLLTTLLGSRPTTAEDHSTPSTMDAIAELGQWLYAQTAGQPFYLFETLKLLRERGVLVPQRGEDGQWHLILTRHHGDIDTQASRVPPGVYEVIAHQLEQLTPAAFAVLAASAILGQQSSFDVLAQVAALSEHDGLLALEEGLRRGVLDEEHSQTSHHREHSYTLRHDLIREVVISQCSGARRRLLHQRALKVLEAVHVSSARLAHHAVEAGLREPAFRYSVAAGDAAMVVFAMQDAIAHFEEARRLLTETPSTLNLEHPFPHAMAEQLYLHLARTYQMAQQWQESREVYTELLQVARQGQQAGLECALLNHLAMLIINYEYDLPTALHLLETAKQKAQASDDLAGQIEVASNLATLIARDQQDPASALPYAEHAVTLARNVGHPHLLAYSLNALTEVAAHDGRWQDAMVYGTEAYDLFQQLSIMPQEGLDTLSIPIRFTGVSPSVKLNAQALAINCQMNVMLGMTFRGKSAFSSTLLPLAQHNYEHALQLRNEVVVLPAAFALLMVHFEMGNYEAALSLVQLAVVLANRVGTPHSRFWFLYLEGWARQRLFHLEAAQQVDDEMRLLAEERLNEQYGEIAVMCQTTIAAMQGDWTKAYEFSLQAVQARSTRRTLQHFSDLARYYEVEALLRGGDEMLAQESVEDLHKRVETNARYRIPLLRSQALVAQWSREIEKAIALLEEASHLAKEIGLPGELWQIQRVLGEMYLTREDEQQAQQAFAQASGIIQELADRIHDEQLRTDFLSAPFIRRVLEWKRQKLVSER